MHRGGWWREFESRSRQDTCVYVVNSGIVRRNALISPSLRMAKVQPRTFTILAAIDRLDPKAVLSPFGIKRAFWRLSSLVSYGSKVGYGKIDFRTVRFAPLDRNLYPFQTRGTSATHSTNWTSRRRGRPAIKHGEQTQQPGDTIVQNTKKRAVSRPLPLSRFRFEKLQIVHVNDGGLDGRDPRPNASGPA